MVTREQLSENRVFGRTRPEYKESAKIALSEGLITDFSDSLGGVVDFQQNRLLRTNNAIGKIDNYSLCTGFLINVLAYFL